MKYLLSLFLMGSTALACSKAASLDAQAYLEAHNEVRAKKNIPALAWGPKLAHHAKVWADYLASHGCNLNHSGSKYGENLAKTWSIRVYSPHEVVGMWAGEESAYNYSTNACDKGKVCGHYTQIVWANTKKVGCAVSRCTDKSKTIAIYVCKYKPAGNYTGQKPY